MYVVPSQRGRWRRREGAHTLLDFATLDGRDNLGQAVMMRLLTPRGELAELGHPEYGSRLHELIGAPNTETRRNLAKLYVLEALAQEPRIEKVVEVTVTPAVEERDLVDILIRVQPVGAAETVDDRALHA